MEDSAIPQKYIISIDLGGTKILASLVNSGEGILMSVKKSTKDKSLKGDYATLCAATIKELLASSGVNETSVKAVCLGIPGSVNPHTGIIGIAPNLNIRNYNIKEELGKQIPFPVLIENDVNLAALGIHKFEFSKTVKNMLVVFVGTGIGGGLVFDGKLYRGSSFFAGEMGHILVDKNGPVCGCGQKGCFEAIASRTAIVNNIVREIKSGKKSKLSKIVEAKEQIKSKALANAIAEGDKIAIKHTTSAAKVIGMMLASVNNLLNFDTIVLGGGLVEANEKFILPLIKESFDKFSLKSTAANTILAATRLGDNAAIFGGIPLAEEFLEIKI
ncbi:MAG: ROK family protein [Ignavibacteriales bacterium]|nr:ROK family protein [Ignavibacteriales bacterium]